MDKSRHDKAGRDGVGMGGRLRQRLAQILLHSSCATTSATAFVGLANTNAVAATITNTASRQEPPPAGRASCSHDHEPQSKHNGRCQHHHSRCRAGALVHISIDCSARSVGATALLPASMPAKDGTAVRSRRSNGKGNKLRPPSHSWSSSTDIDGELAPFSSDGEKREEANTRSTLFSSRSFSSDSTSDFYNTTSASGRSRHHKKPSRRAPKSSDSFRRPAADKHEKETSKTKNVKDGAVAAAGSMAVVKRSHNPYADFRKSMVEMVAGRRIRGADELSELLVCYLSLNSRRHHPAILAAFEDVWEVI